MNEPLDIGNLLANLPCAQETEQSETLLSMGPVRIERIVSAGQVTPEGVWYDQNGDEWVAVLQGSATLSFDDGRGDAHLSAGGWICLPAGCRHRVRATSTDPVCIWLAVHTQ